VCEKRDAHDTERKKENESSRREGEKDRERKKYNIKVAF